MRLFRTTAIAGALVFFELLARQAIAEPQTLDLSSCNNFGKLHICPKTQQDLLLSDKQFEALKKAPKPTKKQIEDFLKKNDTK